MTNSKNTRKTRATVTVSEPVAARKTKTNSPAAGAQAKSTPKAPTKPAPKSASEIASAAVATPAKPKPKLVRDSFTIPRDEYVVIEQLKLRAAKLGRISKKSELLRAGLKALAALADTPLLRALEVVPSVKTGRPKAKRQEPIAKGGVADKGR